jgi:membrane protease YdiL (CAAX protease family)
MNSTVAQDARWGIWGTVIWSAVVMIAFVLIQALFFALYVAVSGTHANAHDLQQEMRRLQNDGDVIAIATLLTTLLCLPMVVGIVKLKRGSRLADYLPIAVPPGRMLGRWLLYTALFILASDTLSLLTGNPVVPEFVKRAYVSSDVKPVLWLALVLAAPLFEETLFRGFMISGFLPTRLGASGAVLLTALAWAIIHIQYGWYGIATIFVFGLLLGTARIRSGSLAMPYLIHAAANAFAALEAAVSTLNM